MRPLVESLKRLYDSGKVTKTRIMELFMKGTITKDEKDYILEK